MIAYSRGSGCLAGAASLRYRMPAPIGFNQSHSDIAQWVEQQAEYLRVAGSNPAVSLSPKQRF